MYKVYMNVQGKFVPIVQDIKTSVPSIFQEEQLNTLEEEQVKAFGEGKLLWIVYLKPEKYGTL